MGISHRVIWNIDYSGVYKYIFFSYVLQEWWGGYIRFIYPLENGKMKEQSANGEIPMNLDSCRIYSNEYQKKALINLFLWKRCSIFAM